jgi:hypothetical protein
MNSTDFLDSASGGGQFTMPGTWLTEGVPADFKPREASGRPQAPPAQPPRVLDPEPLAVPDGDVGAGFEKLSNALSFTPQQAQGHLRFAEAWALTPGEDDARARDAFTVEAERLGLNPDQARQLIGWWDALPATDAPMGEGAARTLAELRHEWGARFEDRLTRAKIAVRQLGGAEMIQWLEETGLGDDPRMVRHFEQLGGRLDAVRTGSQQPARSPEAAKWRIREIMADPKHAYYDAGHPEHHATVELLQGLFRQAYA